MKAVKISDSPRTTVIIGEANDFEGFSDAQRIRSEALTMLEIRAGNYQKDIDYSGGSRLDFVDRDWHQAMPR